MSGASSNEAEWSTWLEPAEPSADRARRPDDPRLGEVVEYWQGNAAALRPGRAVLLGFPQDEGVRRNHGRPGAALAPAEIRRYLYRLTPWDGVSGIDLTEQRPVDLGNMCITASLEDSQAALGQVIEVILRAGAIPVVLGGGHETAYGHYLGYLGAECRVGIINLDAHLDLRPCIDGRGHSGSSFRQALEHAAYPLPGEDYVCLGAQPGSVSRAHWQYAHSQRCVVRWADHVKHSFVKHFVSQRNRLAKRGCQVYVSIDADVAWLGMVPGVSAPSPMGISGDRIVACARVAGRSPHVSSLDLVEINPLYDQDGQSARWAALVIWNFLIGLATRKRMAPSG
jgi:formiminoglutamase